MLEIVTPRTNAARLGAAENLFSALALAHGRKADPIALEIVAAGGLRRFQLRTTSVTDQQRIRRLLGAAYPQADLRPVGGSETAADAARQGPDEQCAACVLRPRGGEYLPLRTFIDRDLDGRSGSAQADPLLGVLSALVDLPSAWRALVQVVVRGRLRSTGRVDISGLLSSVHWKLSVRVTPVRRPCSRLASSGSSSSI